MFDLVELMSHVQLPSLAEIKRQRVMTARSELDGRGLSSSEQFRTQHVWRSLSHR